LAVPNEAWIAFALVTVCIVDAQGFCIKVLIACIFFCNIRNEKDEQRISN
jgi:hypothetical protein